MGAGELASLGLALGRQCGYIGMPGSCTLKVWSCQTTHRGVDQNVSFAPPVTLLVLPQLSLGVASLLEEFGSQAPHP
jgi:hypothetical protein